MKLSWDYDVTFYGRRGLGPMMLGLPMRDDAALKVKLFLFLFVFLISIADCQRL